MAITTEYTYLCYEDTSAETPTWAKLCDIKEFPDLGGAPATVEVTSLSDDSKVYLEGLKDTGSLEFTANYDPTVFNTLHGLEDKEGLKFAVQFGKTKTKASSFSFDGDLSVYVNGAGTESAVEMTVCIASGSDIEFSSTGVTTIS